MNATRILIVVNVLVYVWAWLTGCYTNPITGETTGERLISHGALIGSYVVEDGQWWRIVTGEFLHDGILHIGLNMFALYQVGTFVEAIGGTRRFLIVYFASLIGAGLAVVAFSYDVPTVGASGAIFGLFGALVAIGLRLGKPGRSLIAQALPIILLNLVFTFTIPNISAAGHVGGLVTGFLVSLAVYGVRGPRVAKQAVMSKPLGGEPPADEPAIDELATEGDFDAARARDIEEERAP